MKKEEKMRKKEMKERERRGLPVFQERERFPPGYEEWQLAKQRAEMAYVYSARM